MTPRPASPSCRLAGGSWREIRQEVQPRAMSRKGRRRRWLGWCKLGMFGLGTALVAWGICEIIAVWETNRAALTSAARRAPVRAVTLITDGVLPPQWVGGVLGLPRNASLMSLDLAALRDRLLAYGQVRVAVLTRRFPDALVVTLQERTPVVRVRAADAAGQPQQLLVAKDGVVYDGVHYDPQMLATLPFLDGIKLMRAGAGFRPIEGMDAVSNLLSTAQLQAPHLYRGWQVVSLARLADHDEIVVRSLGIPEIVFSRRADFFRQIARLDFGLDAMSRLPDSGIKTINLAGDKEMLITPERPPEEIFKLQPNFTTQNKGKRDL